MYTLGLNLHHADSSAALLLNGEVVAATEEERFKRIKHWAGVPLESIQYCLNYAGIEITDITAICIGRDSKAKFSKRLKYGLNQIIQNPSLVKTRLGNIGSVKSVSKQIQARFGYCPKLFNVEHHRAHLASAFYASPFEESAIVSIDGSGDFSTIMIGRGKGHSIEVLLSQDFPVSVGILYSATTQFLGFPYYGDEYKVMGLSPYGSPKFLADFEEIMWLSDKPNEIVQWNSEYFDFSNGVIDYQDNVPLVATLYNRGRFESVFGLPRKPKEPITDTHKNIACSLQRHTENLIFGILSKAYDLTGSKNITIAGGVAQNSVANGKIIRNTSFENLYIPSAGHDAGISMGAAQYYFFNTLGNRSRIPLYNANLGVSYTNDEVIELLKKRKINFKVLHDTELFPKVANKIASGKVVGFFQGRSEFGPRALGSRSILADPRNANAQKLLNEKIKMRESFRPFAPSILEEYGDEYFEDYQFTPFMERVLQIRENKRDKIPAVTHVDGSGRLQSVRKSLRPRYHALIKEFYKITGVPILINTSFNENEPVVNHPIHALETFLRTDLDVLVIENCLIEKSSHED